MMNDPMALDSQPPAASRDCAGEATNIHIGQRIEKQTHSMEKSLMAWAEVLDALRWCVALYLPGKPPVLSQSALEWFDVNAGETMTWEKVSNLLAARPPATWFICTAQLRVWSAAANHLPASHPPPSPPLTKREAEVLGWLREGKTGPELAIILGCTRRTVETHISKVYRKIGVRCRAELFFPIRPTN